LKKYCFFFDQKILEIKLLKKEPKKQALEHFFFTFFLTKLLSEFHSGKNSLKAVDHG